MATSVATMLRHPQWGSCELVRVEATDWIVRINSTGILFRIPPERRGLFEVVRDNVLPPPTPSKPLHKPLQQPRRMEVHDESAARNARRVIESLRVGLPSLDGSTRRLAVGFGEMESLIGSFLQDIDSDGGGAMIIKGAYGQGKTFALQILEETAFESGFATCRTEIDATENRLSNPHHIYRDLIRNLKLPGCREHGALALAAKACDLLDQKGKRTGQERMDWLEERLGCFPISWLLSDPEIMEKPKLLGLLEADPNCPSRLARTLHAVVPPQKGRQWAVFRYGSQGDFAGLVISGIGRLLRLLGYKGLLLVMDEMEKWFALDWKEQSRAGNLVGGLIWGATAEDGRRCCRSGYSGGHSAFQSFVECDHHGELQHSGWCGGYPFTTPGRNYVGLAIAMTPRDRETPEHLWSQYGPILVGQVPSLTERSLTRYCHLVMPFIAEAYGLCTPTKEELEEIASEAMQKWRRHGDMNTRSGVQAAIAAFDNWRDWA